jgi:sugar lactone lactonase YvrE
MPELIDVIEVGNVLGEGPVWNEQDGSLWWTDIQGSSVHRLELASRRLDIFPAPERIGSLAFIEGDTRLLAAFETGIGCYTPGNDAIDWIARPEARGSGRRFNDGRIDRQGRFWVATMVQDEARAGAATASLYRLDAHGNLQVQQTGVKIGNGLCTSPDGAKLYFADSPRRTIHAYDLDASTGALSHRRLFATVTDGYPDGAAMDSAGFLWSSRWGAGSLVRHAPDGSVAETVALPVSQPTCVAFGGEDFRLMFVTSAKEGTSGETLAGALLILAAEVRGLPECRWRRA